MNGSSEVPALHDKELELAEDGRRIMRLWKAGELATAINLAMASNSNAKIWLGEAHPWYAGGLATLARMYFEAGHFEHAEAELLECADISFRQFGPMSRQYAEDLSRLSMVCSAMSNRETDAGNLQNAAEAIIHTLALEAPNEALEAKLKGLHRNQQPVRCCLHHEAGLQAEEAHDYAAAESHYRRALASMPSDLIDTSLEYARTQLVLAGLLSIRGRLAEAEAMGEEAHRRLWHILGPADLEVASSLCDLAVTRERVGKAEAAMNAFEEALKICDACDDEAQSAKRMDLQVSVLRGLAGVLLKFAHGLKGDAVMRAIEFYRQADPLVRRHGLRSREFGMHLADVAWAHRLLGALGSAYSLLGASTDIFHDLGDQAKELYHTNLLNMGQLGLDAGYLDEARDHLEKSLAWHKKLLGDEHEEVAKCVALLIAIAALQGRRADFVALVQALQKTDDAIIADRIPHLKEEDALRVAAQIWWRTEHCLLGAVTLGLREHEGLAIVYQLLQARKGVVLASLIARAHSAHESSHEAGTLGGRASLAALRRALGKEAALVEYVKISTEKFGPRAGPTVMQRPDRLGLEDLETNTPILQFNYSHSVDLAELTNRPGRYLAFVVTGGVSGRLELLDLGPAKPIEDLVDAYKQALRAEDVKRRDQRVLETAVSNELGHTLRVAILDPIRCCLLNFQILNVVPDGMVGGVPMDGLPAQGGGNVLDELEVTYLSNAGNLLPSQQLAALSPSLVFGNPDYDVGCEAFQESGRRRLDPLPGSEEEARSIAAILKVSPLLGPDATKSRIQDARSPAVLHLATHGFFDDEEDGKKILNWTAALSNPLRRSCLALAGANRSVDGILSAEEVLTLDLSGTELVTLSSCNSGSGELQLGEGVLGFARAFAIAGARNLVMSVWEIQDKVTQMFMQTFYLNLCEGMPPSSALRAAKLKIRTLLPHPFYWNSFIYQKISFHHDEVDRK